MHWNFYNLDHSNANPIIYRHPGFIIIWIPSFFLRWGKRTQGKLMLTQQIDMLTTQLTHILTWEGFIYGYHDMTYSWDKVLPIIIWNCWKLTKILKSFFLEIDYHLSKCFKMRVCCFGSPTIFMVTNVRKCLTEWANIF